jgi:hypothetical protein
MTQLRRTPFSDRMFADALFKRDQPSLRGFRAYWACRRSIFANSVWILSDARFLNGSDCENLFRMQVMLAISRCAARGTPGFLGFRATDRDARDRIVANSVCIFRMLVF